MDKSLPVFSTAYLPSIEYISSLLKFDNACIEQQEHFPKQTVRNRCSILSPNGIQLLSVPVIQKHVKAVTGEVEISYADNWPSRHWRALEAAYNKSPYFLFYRDDLEKIIFSSEKLLLNLNMLLLKFICNCLSTRIELKLSGEYIENYPGHADFRFLSDCKSNEPALPSFCPMEYQQVFSYKHGFVSNLSIVDLLFNCGPDSLKYF